MVPKFLFAQGYDVGPVQIRGTAGFSTELYGVSGIDARRPWGSGRIFTRVTAEGLGFRYGLDMNLSTEQSTIRQNINQLGLNASYSWLTVAAGDVRPVYTTFGLNGVVVRGGSVDATPGNWQISGTGGRIQRTIRPTEDRPTLTPIFSRWLYAAKIGYNFSNTDFVHFAATYGRDAGSSLEESLIQNFNLQAAENRTLSTNFGKNFISNQLTLEGTFTMSVHNGNFRVGQVTGTSQPTGTGFFSESDGTIFRDYAGRVNLRYAESWYNISTGYERVQPGFVSMGLPYIRNDQEQIHVRPQFYFMNRRVRVGLDFSRARNNISGQLLSTNYRNHAGFNSQVRVNDRFSISSAYRLLYNTVVPRDGNSFDMRQVTHNITLTPAYNWQQGGNSHNLQLSSNLQFFTMERFDENAFQNDFRNLTTSLNYSLSIDSGFTINPGVTNVYSRSDQNNLDAWRSQFSVSRDFRDRLITTSLTGSYTHNRSSFSSDIDREAIVSEQFSVTISAGYRLSIGDYLRLNIRGLQNNTNVGASFSEVQATLQLTHRF